LVNKAGDIQLGSENQTSVATMPSKVMTQSGTISTLKFRV